jgi:hypothetical protein
MKKRKRPAVPVNWLCSSLLTPPFKSREEADTERAALEAKAAQTASKVRASSTLLN